MSALQQLVGGFGLGVLVVAGWVVVLVARDWRNRL